MSNERDREGVIMSRTTMGYSVIKKILYRRQNINFIFSTILYKLKNGTEIFRIWVNEGKSAIRSFLQPSVNSGVRGSVVVKALRYKPTGRGFDSRWCHWNFSVT